MGKEFKKTKGSIKGLDPPEEGRREYLKTVGALVAGLAVGGAAGWLGKPAERVEAPGVTVTAPGATETVTKTVTETVTKTVTAPITPTPTKPLAGMRMAAVADGSKDDLAWSQNNWEAMKAMEEKYGVEIAFAENTPYPEYEKAMRDFSAMGYNIVIGWGYEFGEPAWHIAPDYPEMLYIYTCLTDKPPYDNIAVIVYQEQEAGFLCGVSAGLMTKSNTVGVVLADVGPCVNSFAHGMEYGLKLVNPKGKLLVVYAGTWIDPVAGKDIALGMIAAGADVIASYADGTGLGTVEACKERNVYFCGYVMDQSSLAPDLCIMSFRLNATKALDNILDKLAKNELPRPYQFRADVPSGYIGWVPGKIMPPDVKAEVDEYVRRVHTGEIQVPRDESTYG